MQPNKLKLKRKHACFENGHLPTSGFNCMISIQIQAFLEDFKSFLENINEQTTRSTADRALRKLSAICSRKLAEQIRTQHAHDEILWWQHHAVGIHWFSKTGELVIIDGKMDESKCSRNWKTISQRMQKTWDCIGGSLSSKQPKHTTRKDQSIFIGLGVRVIDPYTGPV